MKKILSIIATIAAVAMFTACGSDDASYQATPTLEIEASDVLFESEGGDGYITAKTSSDLIATTDASWLTLSVTGNVVTVTADPNITLDGRSAVIKLAAGGTETTVTATQKSSIYGIQSLEYEIGDYQASLDIPVVHDQTITVQSNADWLTAVWNEETSQIELVAEDNNEVDPREGTITLTMGDYSDEITITQKGFLLELEKELVNTKTDDGVTVYVKVNHSRPISSVETEDDWASAQFKSSTDEIQCDLAANETGWKRYSTVTITSGPVTKILTISQFDFVNDIQGDYTLWYYSSGWKSLPVAIETTSDTEGILRWKVRYTTATAAFVIPITLDASTESFSIPNLYTMSSKYTTTSGDNTMTYDLMTLVMFTDGTSIFRRNSTNLAIIASLYETEDGGAGFEMDMNDDVSHATYEFYGLRIAYTKGGYAGYTGNFTTYPYCELERVFDDGSGAKAFQSKRHK